MPGLYRARLASCSTACWRASIAGLYGLLQLEEAALVSGSVLLFAVLSLAMWFTRNLHRTP